MLNPHCYITRSLTSPFRVHAFGRHFITLIYHNDIPLCDMIFHFLPTIQWHLQEDHSTVAVFELSQFGCMMLVCNKRTVLNTW